MKTMTLELPDEIYEVLARTALASSQPPADWVASRVPLLLPTRRPTPVLTPEEYEAARQRLRRHAGAAHSGDPNSADNERIDSDLAREYTSSHEGEY